MSSKTAVAPANLVEMRRRLSKELERIANEASPLRAEWEPLLDSQRVTGAVLMIEDLLPFKIPPDKVVRKGGYKTVEEALADMIGSIERIIEERGKREVRE